MTKTNPIVTAVLGPAKEAGFKKSGASWHRDVPVGVQVLDRVSNGP